jgi:hypothetical protein
VQALEEKAGWLSSEFPVPSQETSRVSRSGFLLPWFLLPCFGWDGSRHFIFIQADSRCHQYNHPMGNLFNRKISHQQASTASRFRQQMRNPLNDTSAALSFICGAALSEVHAT